MPDTYKFTQLILSYIFVGFYVRDHKKVGSLSKTKKDSALLSCCYFGSYALVTDFPSGLAQFLNQY